jgi:hypothetical protein
MTPTDIERDKSYSVATAAQRYLYSHPDSGAALLALAKTYHITDPDNYRTFAILVGDIVLGLLPLQEVGSKLSSELNLTSDISNALTRDLLDFLAPLSDPSWQIPQETTDITSEVEAIEATLDTLPQVRTMPPTPAETVYTSTQSAILSEGAATLPTVDPSAPRWDSAR